MYYGCVGGLGKKTESRTFNRATQSVRQTGSAIKPIAVLAPAIDKKIITASTIFDDTEQDFENGYHPEDYSKPLGKVTVRRAVESSQNIPFVEIMEQLKPKTSIKYLEKMGVTTLTEKDNGLPLSLGGLEKGISPLQMAGAYRLKNLLTQPVLGQNGTATYCKISGVDVAAKTGTTDENYDRWLCGFTPYYTAVTWFGYDQNESVEFNQRNPAGLIWANVMSRIHTGLNSAKFEKPNTVFSSTICAETGKKARSGCQNTYTEYYLWSTIPGLCDKHTGSEFKNESDSTKDIKNNVTEIVKGITNEIDATEPTRTDTQTNTQTNTKTNTQTNTVTNSETTKNTTNENKTNTTINKSNTTTNTTTNNEKNNNTTEKNHNTTNSIEPNNKTNTQHPNNNITEE